MDKINFQKILDFLKPSLYYLALFSIPLGMSLWLPIYSPFTMVKTAWFQVLGSLFLLCYLVSFALSFEKRKRLLIRKSYLLTLLPWSLFLLTLLLLNIFSINPLQSFFGSYDRQLGFLFYFTLATWFALIVNYFSAFDKSRVEAFNFWQKGVNRSVLIMSITATLVAIYACLQFLGFDVFTWQEGQLLSRSISSLGQPNFLGSFLLFGLFITAYLIYLRKSLFHHLLIAIALIIQFLALITTGSRSAWLALALTSFTYFIIFLWRRWRYKAVFIALLFSLGLFILLFFLSPARVQTLLNWQEGSLGLRASFYQASPALITDNIWLGTGLENAGEVIVEAYQPEWGIFMKINGSTDKLHNSLIDALLQLGIFGFISYLLLYLFVVYQFIILWQRPKTQVFATFAGGALLAYSLSLLFGLADIVNVFYFWVLAALATAANLILSDAEEGQGIYLKLKKIVTGWQFKTRESVAILYFIPLVIILALLAFFQIYLSVSAIRADHYFLSLYKYSLNQDYATADLLYDYIEEDSINPVYLDNYQSAYSHFIVEALEQEPSLALSHILEKSAKDILLNDLIVNYSSKQSRAVLECYLEGGENSVAVFNELILASPKRPEGYVFLADCLKRVDPSSALDKYEQSLEFLPKRSDVRLHGEQAIYLDFYSQLIYAKIAELEYDQENYPEALAAYINAYYLYPSRIDLLGNIANSYYQLGNYEKAFTNLEHAYRRQASIYWLDRLAALANTVGDSERYDRYLEERRVFSGMEFNYLESDLIFP